MPEITLNIPENTRFHSSLNEIDMGMRSILLNQMRIADPRSNLREQDTEADETLDNWLWDYTRVFQVDDLDTEEIFNTYLLRKQMNNETNTDVTYPLLAFKQDDIDTVFWGTGNRYRQWFFNLPADDEDFETGDTVVITAPDYYRGLIGEIYETKTEDDQVYCTVKVNEKILQKETIGLKHTDYWFPTSDLRLTGDKTPKRYKAKSITGTYSAVILCDNKDELQYMRDHFILRCADAEIWHQYSSPTLDGAKNQIFTVFGIPNIERYPASKDKLKGKGYIYGSAFKINIWACVTDTPLPQSLIETIRMNIHAEGDANTRRIVIND